MISKLCSRPKCLAVLLLLAFVPATASAAAKKKTKKKASTPAAETTPAPEAAPAPAPEPPPPPPRSTPIASSPAPRVFSNSPALGGGVGALDFAGLVSLDIPTESALTVGPRISAEVMYNIMDLAPKLRLAAGMRGSFAYHSGDFDSSAWLLEGVPDAKIKYAFTDALAAYGDIGMGLSFQRITAPFVSDNTLTFTFQFGGGASYAITPNLNLLGEIRFDFYTRSNASHSIAVPTLGLQWHG